MRIEFWKPASAALALLMTGGCSMPRLSTVERRTHGMVFILPGIEGKGPLNIRLAKGLDDGGVRAGIEIYDWTIGATVLGALVNLADYERNLRKAKEMALKIRRYQRTYPDRPVFLIGHSGGAGIAVLTLEQLPNRSSVTSALLLAPAIAPEYDLSRALARTRYGIWNFYSSKDIGFLRLGTTLFGTVDRSHTSAAGAVGFSIPEDANRETRRIYSQKLHHVPYTSKMRESGHRGNHTGWTDRQFVRDWLAPILLEQMKRKRAETAPADPVPDGALRESPDGPSSRRTPDIAH